MPKAIIYQPSFGAQYRLVPKDVYISSIEARDFPTADADVPYAHQGLEFTLLMFDDGSRWSSAHGFQGDYYSRHALAMVIEHIKTQGETQ